MHQPWFQVIHSDSFLTEEQKLENERKSRVRVTSEWYFMELKRWWSKCDHECFVLSHPFSIGKILSLSNLATPIGGSIVISKLFSEHQTATTSRIR